MNCIVMQLMAYLIPLTIMSFSSSEFLFYFEDTCNLWVLFFTLLCLTLSGTCRTLRAYIHVYSSEAVEIIRLTLTTSVIWWREDLRFSGCFLNLKFTS
jgi:hypothetical protein